MVILLTTSVRFDGAVVRVIVVCHIVDNYRFRFDRGVIHAVVGCIVDNYCMNFDRAVVHVVVIYHIVDNYRLRFYRGVIRLIVFGHIMIVSTIEV